MNPYANPIMYSKACIFIELEIQCPPLRVVEIASSKCLAEGEQKKYWWTDEWRDGDACSERCNHHAKTMGLGCCEARPRGPANVLNATRSFCIFYAKGTLTSGYSDSKAALCTGICFIRNRTLTNKKFILSCYSNQLLMFYFSSKYLG